MKRWLHFVSLAAVAVPLLAEAPVAGYQVVRTYPHDRSAFTQGLEYHNGFLYEGTGLNGRSTLRKVELATGRVVQQSTLPYEYFGEGITLLAGEILQLTWQSQVGFVYGSADFKLRRRFRYTGEGWGLTNNGREIFFSDGSSTLRVLNPKTLTEMRRIRVTDGESPVAQLNELEVVEGEILANVWQSDRVARISPSTGKVVGWIDLRGLLSPILSSGVDVLNGIAYDAAGKRLFVTGKLWPSVFEIKVVDKQAAQTAAKPAPKKAPKKAK
ncbi:MAG: glutaminyl-peptide cyclotransferase [Acidobacteria bacterium]|nr:glutaminyl-peptide cyclotransferase [Acidobacteriota bacterium]